MTLVEVMVSVAVLTMTFVAIFAGLFYSYNTSARVRYHDSARFVLKSIGDQFLVMPAQTGDVLNPMWSTTGIGTKTGVGLRWDGGGTVPAVAGLPNDPGNADGLAVILGAITGTPITATVKREVNYLSYSGSTKGQTVTSVARSSAGYLLQGDFTITYTYKGKLESQTLHLVRSSP